MDATKIQTTNSRFIVEIDGITQSRFTEIIIPDATIDVVEYREGGDNIVIHKIPGMIRYSNLILKWELTGSMELYNWYKDIVDGKFNISRKNISVILLDDHGKEAARWRFRQAWPIKYTPPLLNAKGNEIAIEVLEITHEGMVREK
jgi:phage tail-like protein